MDIENLKNKIDELEKLNNDAGSYIPDTEIVNVDSTLDQLATIRAQNILIENMDNDEAREQGNKEISIQNRLRIKMGLSALPFHILNKDLETLITLDHGVMDRTCKEFLAKYKEDQATKQDIEFRINELVNIRIAEKDRQIKRLEFLSDASHTLEQISAYKPEQFQMSRDSKNALVVTPNPAYAVWKRDILELQTRIDHEIKAAVAISKEFEDEKAPNRRESLFKLQKKVDALIEQHQLKEVK
jgi:hypothetical protein